MRHSQTGSEPDPFAFSDARMETAFVQHVGKHTRLSSELLRAVRFVGWTMLVARFSLQTHHIGAGAHATRAIVLAIYLATSLEDVCMLRALRATPPVLHERRKSCNVLRFMIGRMAVAVLMTPTDRPFTSAAAIAMLTGIDMVSDCVRLCVGLRMLALSCLACFCTLLGQVRSSASPVATAAGGSVLIAFGGFLLPAAALACLELRSRLGFIGMHPPGAEKQLALRWHAIAEAVQWPLPFVPEQQRRQQWQQQQQQAQRQSQRQTQWQQRQRQPAAPAVQEATSACQHLPHDAAKAPARMRAPAARQPGFTSRRQSPRSVLDMQF